MEPFLPYGRHCIGDDDRAAVDAVLRSDFLTTGPAVEAFEAAFAEKVGARFAVSCSSATAGLHLAAMALGLGEGDRVAVPTLTFLATANAVRYVGAEVAFADVDPENALVTVDDFARAAEPFPNLKALFPVHLAGQCVDMAAVHAFAKQRKMAVVEDASHALGGATWAGPVGNCRHSDMAVFSLHPVKTLAMGEGGVVTTNDPELRRRLTLLRGHGMVRDAERFQNRDLAFAADGTPNPWYYEMDEMGFNYRASDIACALGASQLTKLDRFVARRRDLVARYDRLLPPNIRRVRRVPGDTAWHIYPVLIDFEGLGIERAVVMHRLRAAGIGTQVHYLPVHRQPYYWKRYGALALPGADAYYRRTLTLPLYPSMTDADAGRVVAALSSVLG